MQVKEYWIDDIKNIKDFQVIDEVENPEINKLNTGIKNLVDDQFIQTATERGIARREKMLKITPFGDDTLETRRFRVQNRWNDKLPYTYKSLIDKLNQLCGENGYAVSLNTSEYKLNIKIELTKKRMFDEASIMARKITPANIIVRVELRYNQYSAVSKLTHNQLSGFTNRQIREEAL